jgi:hypothetical protein
MNICNLNPSASFKKCSGSVFGFETIQRNGSFLENRKFCCKCMFLNGTHNYHYALKGKR